MIMKLTIFGALSLVLLLFISLQKMANINKEKRYQQVWLPLIAVIFMIAVLKFDIAFLNRMTNLIFEILPVLRDYSLITFNLTILMFFVLIKGIFKGVLLARVSLEKKQQNGTLSSLSGLFHRLIILLPEKFAKEVTKKDQSMFIAYFHTKRGIRLKPEWSFARMLFKLTSYVAFLIIISFLLLASLGIWPSMLELFPNYPILTFILMSELTWFLGGLLPSNAQVKFEGKDVVSQKIAQYDTLYEEYKRLWPNRILTSGKIQEEQGSKLFNYEGLAKDPTIQAKVNHICTRLKKDGHCIDGNYAQILTHILEEEDVIIEDPIYQELSHYFFPAIYGLLSKNKKLLVLTPHSKSAEVAVRWFQEGIHQASGLDFAWTISTFQDAVEQNLDSDILVLSPNDILQDSFIHFLTKYKNTGYIEGVIYLEAEKILSEYGLLVQLFNMKLNHITRKKPQYIVLSQWYEGLEHTVRELLHSDPKDTLGSLPKSEQLYYMIWKKEGEEAFQSKILSKMVHRQLEPEAILLLPAKKFGVETVLTVNQGKNATRESIEELLDNQIHLKKYGLTDNQIHSLRNQIDHHEQNLIVPVKDFGFVLARDHNQNLVDALMHWNSIGKKSCFVHVISPPYLLRDYLSDNLEHFLDNSRKFAPIASKLSHTTWRKAFTLLERLSSDYINEEDIKKTLKPFIHNDDTIMETINKIFRLAFQVNVDFLNVLNMRNEEVFDKSKQTFITLTQYHLPAKARQEIFPTWFRFMTIKTITGEVLGRVLEDHVYQNYLIGQYHAFNGLLYRITNIDRSRAEMEVSFETPVGDICYRQSRRYSLDIGEGISRKVNTAIPVLMNGFEVRKCMVEGQIEVETPGYFSFSKGIDLVDEQTNLILLNEQTKKSVHRNYQNGNALLVKLTSINHPILYPDKVAFTIAFLLNEVLPTLFPQTYPYLAVCTNLQDDFFSESSFLEKLRLYSPQLLKGRTYNSKDSIYLYIIEDSTLQMGLLESIMDKWNHILEIVADYLEWTMHRMLDGYEPFYFLGNKQLPEVFDLDNTLKLLNCLTPNNELKHLRSHKESELDVGGLDLDTIVCNFCGDSFPSAESECLDDERNRCIVCRSTAIDSVEELEPLFEDVREFLVFDMDLALRRDIKVTISNAKEIQNANGEEFIPTASFDARIVGRAIRSNENQFSIFIENGAPKIMTLSTLVHELTHIWQFEHLIIENYSVEQLEGLAVWTEIFYLEKMGENIHAEKLKTEMSRRNDEYGRGYRELIELLKEQPEGTSPFELYQKKVMVYE
jgi:hypothetical protein